MKTPKEFFDKPYHERQLITFINDEEYKQIEDSEKKLVEIIKRSIPTIRLYPLIARVALMPSGLVAVELFITLFNFYQKRKKRLVLVLPRSYSEEIILPPGHPSPNQSVYVAHPIDASVYYPISEFHRFVFQHKCYEFLSLLYSLGATKISGKYITGYSKEISLAMSGSVEENEASAKYKQESKLNQQIIYYDEANNTSKPQLPDDRKLVWYPFENMWQNTVNARLKHGLKKSTVNIEYNEDFGIDSSLATKINGSGLSISGKYEEFKKTLWSFEVEFN